MAIAALILGACGARSRRVSLNVVLFSYLSRPILDVFLGRRFIGIAGAYPYSGNGTMTGVPIDLGIQTITWRLDGPPGTPGNGETVSAANTVRLDEVPTGARYLGVHIYPDNTVELLCSKHPPELSKRGELLDLAWLKNRTTD